MANPPIEQVITNTELVNKEPALYFREADQTDPAGRFRARVQDNVFYWEKATAADWSTYKQCAPTIVVPGTTDSTTIQAAIDVGGDVYIAPGNYSISATIINKLGTRVMCAEGAIFIPTANVDVIKILAGSSWIGGTVDVLHSDVTATFTKAGLLLSGYGVSTANTFYAKTIVRDMMLLGYSSDVAGTDTGKGLHIKCANGEGLAFAEVDNIKIAYFKHNLYIETAGTGWINNNIFKNLYLAYGYYSIYINLAGADIGQNEISANVQPSADFMQDAMYISGSPNNNRVELNIADGSLLVTDYAVLGVGGLNNEFWITCDESKIFYDGGTNNIWHLRNVDAIKAATPISMKDRYSISIPFKDTGAIASDIGNYNGQHSVLLYNTPTWGTGTVSGASKLTFDAVDQYGKLLNSFVLNGNKTLTFIFAPAFAYNDGVLHVIAEWYQAAGERIQLRSTVAGSLEVYWGWSLPGAGNATASAAVVFAAGDILIITVVKDETNDLLRLWVNGVLISSVAATGQTGTNAGSLYINSDHTPANYSGGDFYFVGLLKGMPSTADIEDLTRQQAKIVGVVLENSGTATITAAATTVVVTHGLATTPTRVFVSPTALAAVTHWWVDTLTATQFTINSDQVPGGAGAIFDWTAQVGEG